MFVITSSIRSVREESAKKRRKKKKKEVPRVWNQLPLYIKHGTDVFVYYSWWDVGKRLFAGPRGDLAAKKRRYRVVERRRKARRGGFSWIVLGCSYYRSKAVRRVLRNWIRNESKARLKAFVCKSPREITACRSFRLRNISILPRERVSKGDDNWRRLEILGKSRSIDVWVHFLGL